MTYTSPSSVLRLPTELLATVFLAYKDLIQYTASDCSIPTDNSIAHQFLALTSVCRTFRNVLYSTSQFWTHIVLALHLPPSACSDNINERFYSELKGLETWLSRSGRRHPIQIHLTYVPAASTRSESDLISIAVDMIAAYHSRWEEVSFYLPWTCLVRLGRIMVAGSTSQSSSSSVMPMLKKATLIGERQEYYGFLPPREFLNAFSETNAPALDELSLSMYHQSSIIAPWSRLKRFEGHRLSVDDVLAVLGSTPLLEECTLTNTVTATMPDPWGPGVDLSFGAGVGVGLGSELPMVHVPQLKSLTLNNSIAPLRHLVLPSLDTLVLNMEKRPGEEEVESTTTRNIGFGDWGLAEAGYTLESMQGEDRRILASDFINFVRRSECSLRSLHLSVDSISVTTLMGCIKATPQLRELTVHQHQHQHAVTNGMGSGVGGMNRTFMKQAVGRLMVHQTGADVVPLLQRLELLGCCHPGGSSFSARGLVDMIWSRAGAADSEKTSSLNSFLLSGLNGSDGVREEIMADERMKAMVQLGRNIRID